MHGIGSLKCVALLAHEMGLLKCCRASHAWSRFTKMCPASRAWLKWVYWNVSCLSRMKWVYWNLSCLFPTDNGPVDQGYGRWGVPTTQHTVRILFTTWNWHPPQLRRRWKSLSRSGHPSKFCCYRVSHWYPEQWTTKVTGPQTVSVVRLKFSVFLCHTATIIMTQD